jgi:branched-subunit amino acid aminotransferase/4-amino-4-deoxychorismate lyase
LSAGALAGVTRQFVVGLCQALGIRVEEANFAPAQLLEAEGVFLTLSSLGIIEAATLDGVTLRRSPLVGRLRQAYSAALHKSAG